MVSEQKENNKICKMENNEELENIMDKVIALITPNPSLQN